MKFMFLGAPGAGKGTYSEVLSQNLNIPTVITGDILRKELKSGSKLAFEIERIIIKGHLVPDDVIIKIVSCELFKDRYKKGFILDGFPRTVVQAEALEKIGIEFNKVFDIIVNDELIYKRMSGRRICKGQDCNKVYNIYNIEKKPKVALRCDFCNQMLVCRADDSAETVKERLKVYRVQTAPLKNFYFKRGNLVEIDGAESFEKVTQKLVSICEGLS